MAFRTAIAALAALLALDPPAAHAQCRDLRFEAKSYTACSFDPAETRLEIFNLDAEGDPIQSFSALQATLAAEGKSLTFAMNAGMFDEALKPIGLYVEDGVQAKRLNRRGGFGNFHLKPNGVFYIDDAGAGVAETESFARSGRKPRFATQSGPMLVVDGKLHPKFSATGTSYKIRNGVGVDGDGRAVFVISGEGVNFHEFARLFRDELDCPNALFLDGSVSSLYASELGRNDDFLPLGPMVGAYELK